MAIQATLHDFEQSLARIEATIVKDQVKANLRVISEFALGNRTNSGSMTRCLISELENSTASLVDLVLEEHRLYALRSGLPESDLRPIMLEGLTRAYKSICLVLSTTVIRFTQHPSAVPAVNDAIKAQWDFIKHRLRRLDIGIDDASIGGLQPMVTNMINAHTVIGGVQLGTSHSTMTVSNTLDNVAIERAVKAVEDALIGCGDSPLRSDIEGDLATMRAQLRKSSPASSILREAGKSLRSLTEGVAAGLLTVPAQAALVALVSLSGG